MLWFSASRHTTIRYNKSRQWDVLIHGQKTSPRIAVGRSRPWTWMLSVNGSVWKLGSIYCTPFHPMSCNHFPYRPFSDTYISLSLLLMYTYTVHTHVTHTHTYYIIQLKVSYIYIYRLLSLFVICRWFSHYIPNIAIILRLGWIPHHHPPSIILPICWCSPHVIPIIWGLKSQIIMVYYIKTYMSISYFCWKSSFRISFNHCYSYISVYIKHTHTHIYIYI